MKIVFVVNNKNNRFKKVLPKLEQYARQANIGSVQFHHTQRKQHAIDLTHQAVTEGCDVIIAVGGDGTLHEVINGLLQSSLPASAYPAVGLLPQGSANDFARTAGLSSSIEALFQLIRSNSTRPIDLGKIYLHDTQESRYFINIASLGLGPEVVQGLERSSSWFGPGFQYFQQIIKTFFRYTKKTIRCSSNNWTWEGKLLQMAVANGRFFGNAICIAPEAQLSDGQLQLALFGDLSIWDYLRNIGKLKKGIKIAHPQVHYHTAKEVRVESSDACGIEADGEYVGLVPATFSILPNAIRFVMPSNTD
ncbi:diacylglycerol kinase family lipid kinase [Aggregatimonas sangjinii]|uniref:Diacylglycerol kinase family lipid kinase n=1 Tax=Aggregatimonas sangjinii TaxID=2583587 RepID=A0A5B7SS66_9FLAO|nr:diacylglycerol kinase family protein [Aggregatimonas sangjinii]QCW99852.1 diacylglycerol kinase family lipid kinase [Aggregatimonas sangjinii]